MRHIVVANMRTRVVIPENIVTSYQSWTLVTIVRECNGVKR
jgi:hypothetical protein